MQYMNWIVGCIGRTYAGRIDPPDNGFLGAGGGGKGTYFGGINAAQVSRTSSGIQAMTIGIGKVNGSARSLFECIGIIGRVGGVGWVGDQLSVEFGGR